jgi:hypothetical protein
VTSPTRSAGLVAPAVSVQWLASVLVGASLLELIILRIGTRTAIHIPGLEEFAGPYRLFAATGRLAYFTAAVLLCVLLPYLARELYLEGQTHAAAGLSIFVVVAGLGALRVIGNDVMAPAIIAIIASLALVVASRRRHGLGLVIAMFVVAYLAHASYVVLQGSFGGELPSASRQLPLGAEWLAVLAAISSGPLVRRTLQLERRPSRRLMGVALAVGLVVTGAIVANPYTVHILMLWNFGLTGTLPAAVYGLATASLTVAVASSARCGQQRLALALTLLFLGGLGLTSTYQSGLIVAGLGLLNLADSVTGGGGAEQRFHVGATGSGR